MLSHFKDIGQYILASVSQGLATSHHFSLLLNIRLPIITVNTVLKDLVSILLMGFY